MAFYTFQNKSFTQEEVVRTALDSVLGISSKAEFTAEQRRDAINQILRDLAQNYEENKYKIFKIIEETLNPIMPEEIKNAFRFAEVKEFAPGDTPVFTIKSGQVKAYWVASGGTVRRYRRDKKQIVVPAESIQAKIYEELDRLRAGLVDFNELIEDAKKAIMDEIKRKIHTTLIGVFNQMPSTNVHTGAGINEAELDKLIKIVKSYGKPIIVGTYAGLSQLPTIDGLDADLKDLRNQGYTSIYKGGIPTLEIENPVTDETNSEFSISDKYLFIIPEGREKILKVGFEGGILTRETDGADWTKEWELLRKISVAVLQFNHFAIYQNTELT